MELSNNQNMPCLEYANEASILCAFFITILVPILLSSSAVRSNYDACTEIANFSITDGLVGAKLPDPTDCRKWFTCNNQKQMNTGYGDCNEQPYDMDNQFCNSTFKCVHPDPRG